LVEFDVRQTIDTIRTLVSIGAPTPLK